MYEKLREQVKASQQESRPRTDETPVQQDDGYDEVLLNIWDPSRTRVLFQRKHNGEKRDNRRVEYSIKGSPWRGNPKAFDWYWHENMSSCELVTVDYHAMAANF